MDDLKNVDLNLLKALVALVEEKNVTKAGERLSRGQSAASSSLARLREIVVDELLVRSGREMTATPRAEELLRNIRPLLDQISNILHTKESFIPQTTTRTFRLGLPDDLEVTLLPLVIRALSEEAPQAQLIVKSIDYETFSSSLDSNIVDLAVTVTDDEIPSWLRKASLGNTGFTGLYCPNRIANAPSTLEIYLQHPHILVSILGDANGIVDDALRFIEMKRTISVVVPRFATLPTILQQTDMIATIPDYVAKCFSSTYGLKTFIPPVKLEEYSIDAVWHGARNQSKADQWFRNLIAEQAQALFSSD
ncbi:LysR family transcriptional regulator [Kiloniella sp. EL199]|uniref:LysR family transcriptional regulator n=1 Tax=Kiloniella sp. EL199 TaxID=2107581 RepID=UPI000EA1D84A|nr:LysR family transcriptional regulator [Kiloniella sp. EL199]